MCRAITPNGYQCQSTSYSWHHKYCWQHILEKYLGGGTKASKMALSRYTWDEIKTHNTKTDCWVVIDNYVYDITPIMATHPGGTATILNRIGVDVKSIFNGNHKQLVRKRLELYLIGRLEVD